RTSAIHVLNCLQPNQLRRLYLPPRALQPKPLRPIHLRALYPFPRPRRPLHRKRLALERCHIQTPPHHPHLDDLPTFLPTPPTPPPLGHTASVKERIQKILANAGVASRRGVEDMVRQGRIAVNGRIVTDLPILIEPEHDKVEVDGDPLRLKPRQAAKRIYILM